MAADPHAPPLDEPQTREVPEGARLVVAAAIVDDLVSPAVVLAARRSAPTDLAGRWEFPGGKVEPGEGELAALHRELREELGVGVEVGQRLQGPVGDLWAVSPRHVMAVFLCRLLEGEPAALQDHDELRWLTRDTLFDVDWLPGDLPVAQALGERMGPSRGEGDSCLPQAQSWR